jgi:outer membrane protein TolC
VQRHQLLLWLVIMSVFHVTQAAAQERVLGLQEAVETALRDQPAVRASGHGVDAARERESASISGYLPSLDLELSYFRTTGNYGLMPGQDRQQADVTSTGFSSRSYNLFNFGLRLTQPIWDFGRTSGNVDARKAATDEARQGLQSVRHGAWFQVVTAYYAVLASQRMVEVAARTLDYARRHAERANALYEAGARPRVEVVRAQADYMAAEAALNATREQQQVAALGLLAVMGVREPFDFIVREEPIPDVDTLLAAAPALEDALKARPERAAIEARIKVAEAGVVQAKGDWFPFLAAGAAFTDTGSDIRELAWNWQVGIGLTWPLFSGLSTWRNYRAAKSDLEATRASLDGLDLAIRTEIEQARTRVVQTTGRLEPLQAGVTAAREALLLAEQRYQAGQGNQVEFLDAQRGLADSETMLVQARYDLAVAWASWRRAIGAALVGTGDSLDAETARQ